ncbi:hypothetical protein [Sphingomonas sp. BAUL-RG-20F-R05-02]|uniref:hypothetical protein n=1 Tax=Sphingomonas sp. BAUL-RG-20F-R05-02 TaxID=2914830 RepID=UPI001F59271D|nr:hypothetical protein [Sphingomonas sp. BAUL-RG-20F-R05-02]
MPKRADDDGLVSVTQGAGAIDQPDSAAGTDILGRIFRSKDVSRQVTDHTAGESGVSSTVIKAMA